VLKIFIKMDSLNRDFMASGQGSMAQHFRGRPDEQMAGSTGSQAQEAPDS